MKSQIQTELSAICGSPVFNLYSDNSSDENYRKINDVILEIGKLKIIMHGGSLVHFNSGEEILDEFTPEKEKRYQKALEILNQRNHDKNPVHSLSQKEVLELLKKIAKFKQEFEEPVSWQEFLNPFGPNKKHELCIDFLQSGTLSEIEDEIARRKRRIEYYDNLNQKRVEKYKALIAALTRTEDVIKQDPLLCVV